MIIPAILSTLKGKLLLGVWTIFTTVAVTEAFMGQLMIAVIVALIGAAPPTAAIIIMSRKQSQERREQNKELLEKQDEVVKAVDGQLSKFVEAKQQLGHAEGKAEAQTEARVAEGEKALAQQEHVAATPVIPAAPVPGTAENPVHNITVNTPEDPVNVKQQK